MRDAERSDVNSLAIVGCANRTECKWRGGIVDRLTVGLPPLIRCFHLSPQRLAPRSKALCDDALLDKHEANLSEIIADGWAAGWH